MAWPVSPSGSSLKPTSTVNGVDPSWSCGGFSSSGQRLVGVFLAALLLHRHREAVLADRQIRCTCEGYACFPISVCSNNCV